MSGILKGGKSVGGLVALVVAGVVALISTGQIQVPLPAPAHGKVINVISEDVLPWRPQPLQGRFAPNKRLYDAVRLFEGQILGAESVAVRPTGGLTLLDRYGNLFEAPLTRTQSALGSSSSSSSSWRLEQQPVAQLGPGRPLGYHFDADENLVVCDSLKGLVKYSFAAQQVTLLASHVSLNSAIDPGSEITYVNDLAIASDGKVYFTSCSDIVPGVGKAGYYDTFRAWMLGLAQGLPEGRLMMYDPHSKETVVLAKGFYYVNGVALSQDEDYLVLAETDRIRLLKFWLKGPKAGTYEPLIENLPGPPDGVSTAPDGNFWVGLVSPIPPIAALLRDPTVRALYVWLPDWLKPPIKAWGAVAKVSGENGAVLDFLMDPTGSHVSHVSAALEHDGKLFLGNLAGNYVSYIDLEASAAAAAAAASPAAAAAAPAARRRPSILAQAAEVQAEGKKCGSGDEGMPDVDRALLFIHGKIKRNKVVLFSKSYCPYCRKAKDALLTLLTPEQMTVIELDQMEDRPANDGGEIPGEAMQQALLKITGAKTVPRVFIGGQFVGGGDDTARLVKSGKIKEVLSEIGVLPQEDEGAATESEKAAGEAKSEDDGEDDYDDGDDKSEL